MICFQDDKCRYKPRQKGATDKGFTDIESGSESDLKAAVATVGPISVAIDASAEDFQFYSEGLLLHFIKICSLFLHSTILPYKKKKKKYCKLIITASSISSIV